MSEASMPSEAAPASESNAPATYRLVIRAQIIPETPPGTVEQQPDKRTIAWIVGGLAALLVSSWIGISVFRGDSRSVPAANEGARIEQTAAPEAAAGDPAAAVRRGSLPPSTTSPAASSASSSIATVPTEPLVEKPPRPTHEALPAASRNALRTVRGTIRVAVRVTIDREGRVIDAIAEVPGPSRYFERISLEAARQWVFTSAVTDKPRTTLLQFQFTRNGATAANL
jgi:hypothetical protein